MGRKRGRAGASEAPVSPAERDQTNQPRTRARTRGASRNNEHEEKNLVRRPDNSEPAHVEEVEEMTIHSQAVSDHDELPALLSQEGQQPQEDDEEEEEIEFGELQCALCHDLITAPITAPCQHSFCGGCNDKLFLIRITGEPAIPPCRRSRPCPMCRQQFTQNDITPATTLETAAKSAHPALYARRLVEAAAAKNALIANEPSYFTLLVGNTFNVASGRETRSGTSTRSSWKFFIELRDAVTGLPVNATEYIERVVMHVNLNGQRQELTAPPFTVTRTSAGGGGADAAMQRELCFAVVYFKDQTRLQACSITWLCNMSSEYVEQRSCFFRNEAWIVATPKFRKC